jgi:hypothetical protein
MMGKFKFLIGTWDLEYRVPKSAFSEAATGSGKGTFKRTLDNKYVFFDYEATVGGQQVRAHGVFVRDDKINAYRYWWFESSGNFETATCNFVNDDILFMNWHDTLLMQTFKKESPDKVVLRMENPDSQGNYEPVLEVIFTRK